MTRINELLIEGLTSIIEKDYDAGIKIFNKVLFIDADCIDALIGLGEIYSIKGDSLESETHFNYVFDIEPGHKEATLRLSQHYTRQENFEQALNLQSDLLEKHPEDKSICLDIGKNYMCLNQYNLAISTFSKFIDEVESSKVTGWMTLSPIKRTKRKLDLSGRRVTNAGLSYAYLSLIEAYHKTDNPEVAKKLTKKMVTWENTSRVVDLLYFLKP